MDSAHLASRGLASPGSMESISPVGSLAERNTPWKLFLPVSRRGTALAVNLKKRDLIRLGRSFGEVHIAGVTRVQDAKEASEEAGGRGGVSRFAPLDILPALGDVYTAIAVDVDNNKSSISPERIIQLLKPGGAAIWVGGRGARPTSLDIARFEKESFRRYALLPPDTRKIALPLEGTGWSRSGLEMFFPLRRKNRMILRMCHLTAAVGCQALLGVKQIVVARKGGVLTDGEYFLEWLRRKFDPRVAEVTIYSGWTRIVFQLMDADANVLGFAKVADTVLGRKGNERETGALESLKVIQSFQGAVPEILMKAEWEGHSVQIQGSVGTAGKKYSYELLPPHFNFLGDLALVGRRDLSLEQWPDWQRFLRFVSDEKIPNRREAEALHRVLERSMKDLAGRKIPFHRTHGDFTPWHVLLAQGRVSVVDWERSEPIGLPFFDIAYFQLNRMGHLDKGGKPEGTDGIHPVLLPGGTEPYERLAGRIGVSPGIARLAVIYAYAVSKHLDLLMDPA